MVACKTRVLVGAALVCAALRALPETGSGRGRTALRHWACRRRDTSHASERVKSGRFAVCHQSMDMYMQPARKDQSGSVRTRVSTEPVGKSPCRTSSWTCDSIQRAGWTIDGMQSVSLPECEARGARDYAYHGRSSVSRTALVSVLTDAGGCMHMPSRQTGPCAKREKGPVPREQSG